MSIKFKPEVKEKFVAALRSGEYKQIRGALHKDDCFCAEGVLADLYAKEHNLTWETEPSQYSKIIGTSYYSLGQKVWQWARGSDCPPTFDVKGEGRPLQLVQLNDSMKFSFEQIADLVEVQA